MIILAAAEAAAREILRHYRGDFEVELKSDQSPVTIADRRAEEIIREHVLAAHPDAGFLGEETGTVKGTTGIRFIVDPIDGTRAFVRGWSTWSVLLGVEADGVPVVGIAYMPAAGDFFVAVQGQGTTHNGERVQVSKLGPLADATVTHGGLQQFTMSGVGETLKARNPETRVIAVEPAASPTRKSTMVSGNVRSERTARIPNNTGVVPSLARFRRGELMNARSSRRPWRMPWPGWTNSHPSTWLSPWAWMPLRTIQSVSSS